MNEVTERDKGARIINRAALRRFFRAELIAAGWNVTMGKLPRGGLAELEKYLESLARANVQSLAKRRADKLLKKFNEEGGC